MRFAGALVDLRVLAVILLVALSPLALLTIDVGLASIAPWMFALPLLLAAVATGVWHRTLRARLEPWHVAFGVFLLGGVLSLLPALDTFIAVRRLAHLAMGVAVAWAVSLAVRTEGELVRFSSWLAVVAAGVVAFAFGRYALELAGVLPVSFEAVYRSGIPRVVGTFADPNMLAQWVAGFLPLVVALFLAGRVKGTWRIAALAVLTAAMVAAIVLSYSRGAIFALAAAYLVFYPSWRALGALGLGGVAAYLLGGAALRQRIHGTLTLSDFSTNERLLLWEAAWNMMRDHPLTGVGLNHFPLRYFEYALPGAPRRVSFPHNIYLELGAEAGLLALLGFVAAVALILVPLAVRARRLAAGRGHAPRAQHLLRGVGVGLLAVLLHNATTQGLVQPQLWILVGLGAAAATIAATSRSPEAEEIAPSLAEGAR